MSERIFDSPTTPGLKVDFSNLVVERVCLHMDRSLGPHFWRRATWRAKYARECVGFRKLIALHGDWEDPVVQRAILTALDTIRPQSLLREPTLKRLDRVIQRELAIARQQRARLAEQAPPVIEDVEEFSRRNARLVPLGTEGRAAMVQEIEKRGKEEDPTDI